MYVCMHVIIEPCLLQPCFHVAGIRGEPSDSGGKTAHTIIIIHISSIIITSIIIIIITDIINIIIIIIIIIIMIIINSLIYHSLLTYISL